MNETAQRTRTRRDWPTSVRLRCSRCDRVLATVAGTADTPATWTDGTHSGAVAGYGRFMKLSCRCGADVPVRGEKLQVAYQRVAGLASRRERVLCVPDDLAAT